MTQESDGVRQVLNAAAFTYLARLAQQIGSFVFFVIMIALTKGLLLPA